VGNGLPRRKKPLGIRIVGEVTGIGKGDKKLPRVFDSNEGGIGDGQIQDGDSFFAQGLQALGQRVGGQIPLGSLGKHRLMGISEKHDIIGFQ